jgi:vacuolar protein sorting-associated protein 35
LLEGVQTPDMITRHFRNTLAYIVQKKALTEHGKANERWHEVDVVGALLKMGMSR